MLLRSSGLRGVGIRAVMSNRGAARTFTSAADFDNDPVFQKKLRQLAQQQSTGISINALYHYGTDTASAQRIRNAQFLQSELPIRYAQRVHELQRLPFGLSNKDPIKRVRGMYTDCIVQLLEMDKITTPANRDTFVEILQSQATAEENAGVIQAMASGVLELRSDMQRKGTWDGSKGEAVDQLLDRFYSSRIGLRFIADQYLASHRDMEAVMDGSREARPNRSGVIHADCSPAQIAEHAAEDASRLCEYHLGDAPEVEIIFSQSPTSPKGTFTYVPSHLHYMMMELFKNAMRATVETHRRNIELRALDPDTDLPPIKVIIVMGEEDVTIKVSDKGGGIPRSDLHKLWTYMHSTAPRPVDLALAGGVSDGGLSVPPDPEPDDVHGGGRGGGGGAPPLAGYGVGIPMSRLFARYFGGDLGILSMEGYGTDCYLHLNRLGHKCENLPENVTNSPGEQTSRPSDRAAAGNGGDSAPVGAEGAQQQGRAGIKARVAELERTNETLHSRLNALEAAIG